MSSKYVPMRTCVACRREAPKRELVRLVRGADGIVEIDQSGRKSGRGAYLCRTLDCWQSGLSGSYLGQALRAGLSSEERERLLNAAQEMCRES